MATIGGSGGRGGSGGQLSPPRLAEVADGVFAYLQPDGGWFLDNTGFVRGRGQVLAVDTCATERRTRRFLAVLEATCGRPVDVLVNTHHHGDHTNGNCLVGGATIVGHDDCRAEIVRAGILRPEGLFDPVEWGTLEPAPPMVTFRQRLDVHLDDTVVELHHLTASAHTSNDVVAWIPGPGVLFAGDLVVNGSTPLVVMGSVAGWLEALDRIVELEPSVIVPGHGAPCDVEAVDSCGRYLRWLQLAAAETRAAGLSPLEAARSLELGEFAGLLEPERLVGNLHRAYAELEGSGAGSVGVDLAAAFADMVTFNGGRPLRCRA